MEPLDLLEEGVLLPVVRPRGLPPVYVCILMWVGGCGFGGGGHDWIGVCSSNPHIMSRHDAIYATSTLSSNSPLEEVGLPGLQEQRGEGALPSECVYR